MCLTVSGWPRWVTGNRRGVWHAPGNAPFVPPIHAHERIILALELRVQRRVVPHQVRAQVALRRLQILAALDRPVADVVLEALLALPRRLDHLLQRLAQP